MSRKPGAKGEVGPCLGDLQRQAEGLVEELEGMPELRMPDLITADATPEAARDLLGRNGEKLGIIAAEGDQLDVLLGRYGEGKANLGLFLNGHAGDPCPAHRVGRDMPLERPALVWIVHNRIIVTHNIYQATLMAWEATSGAGANGL